MPTQPSEHTSTAWGGIVDRMLGGDVEQFFTTNWQRRPLVVRGAGNLDHPYAIQEFVDDLQATQAMPYGVVSVRDGKRHDTYHNTGDELREALGEGAVCAIKLSREWYGPNADRWSDFHGLFRALQRAVSMYYMTPDRSEDVDLFAGGPQSCLGTHFDRTEVFNLQLSGERRWTFERQRHLDGILEIGRNPNWYPDIEIEFSLPTDEMVLRPGDAIYVPAYAIHRVTGVSWSVSLSLGVRAYNEIDVVEHLLDVIRQRGYMRRPPLGSYPESMNEQNAQAKLELIGRVRSLLEEVESVALASLLSPAAPE